MDERTAGTRPGSTRMSSRPDTAPSAPSDAAPATPATPWAAVWPFPGGPFAAAPFAATPFALWPAGPWPTGAEPAGAGTAAGNLAAAWMPTLTDNPVMEYWRDAAERTLIFLDTLRERGNTYLARTEQLAPNVLSFEAELILDGRNLPRPVNYVLVRIAAPPGVKVDEGKRPFIVFDPRAGHGPGIGGMKQDSEIGMALAAGHPCYFVGFLPEPMPGQTIEDVCRAEAEFVRAVIARHPHSETRPCLIGNCQAGWQIMMMAAIAPDLPGPIVLAGSPLSYWAGKRGHAPLRYLGGLLGGTWLTALTGDLGNGIFDGANLIANFERMHPSNTYWKKAYDVWSKIDTEPARFLDFETWWGSPVLLNAGEMQSIADELFVGNRLASGELRASDGMRVDLRNIRSPIIVFCSWGDDITPPPQALGWVTDLYATDEELVAGGQTIVYTLHQTIGHLGIFVSGKVATKEHAELVSAMDLIDVLPPGLYEAVITEVTDETENRQLVNGKYLFRLEARTLDDIRALGNNEAEDERRFATVARVSEVNLGLYRTFLAPLVKQVSNEATAGALRAMHPNRLRFAALSDRNPMVAALAPLAEQARANRHPAAPDNPLIAIERAVSSSIVQTLDAWTSWRDALEESTFLAVYGSPLLQALVGLGGTDKAARPRIGRDQAREAAALRRAAELDHCFDEGTPADAFIRAMLYVGQDERQVDERGFRALQNINAMLPPERRLGIVRLREVIRTQTQLLQMDARRAVDSLPALLPKEAKQRQLLLDTLRQLLTAIGPMAPARAERFARIEKIVGSKAGKGDE